MVLELRRVSMDLAAESNTVPILHDISVAFPARGSVAIVGPSGSGKTTLLMICAGLLQPTQGQALFGQTDMTLITEDQLADLRRQNIGIVFQNFHLIPTMTAQENVAIPLELSGTKDAAALARAALESVGLSHRLDHYPSQLSGGEQQRVAIARALSIKPRLILADEPTGNLDQDTGEIVIDLLFKHVANNDATLVLITHDPDLAARCDHKITLRDGRVVSS
jgi:putative ABC transport system ATP-binding protein